MKTSDLQELDKRIRPFIEEYRDDVLREYRDDVLREERKRLHDIVVGWVEEGRVAFVTDLLDLLRE